MQVTQKTKCFQNHQLMISPFIRKHKTITHNSSIFIPRIGHVINHALELLDSSVVWTFNEEYICIYKNELYMTYLNCQYN